MSNSERIDIQIQEWNKRLEYDIEEVISKLGYEPTESGKVDRPIKNYSQGENNSAYLLLPQPGQAFYPYFKGKLGNDEDSMTVFINFMNPFSLRLSGANGEIVLGYGDNKAEMSYFSSKTCHQKNDYANGLLDQEPEADEVEYAEVNDPIERLNAVLEWRKEIKQEHTVCK